MEKPAKINQKLLVTGAGGFLGWNLCKKVAGIYDIYGLVHSSRLKTPDVSTIQIDLTDYKSVKNIFHTIKPDLVIHTAALSIPDYCQAHPDESARVNIDATENLAGLTADHNIPIVFTSTDMVFDGLKPPYKETDPICPVNLYGEHKVEAERKILENNEKGIVCRMALMYGPVPENRVSFLTNMINAMRNREPVKLFHDEYRSMLDIESAVDGLLLAANNSESFLHLGGKDSVSRYEFGKLAAQISDINNPVIVSTSTKELNLSAPRAPDLTFDINKAESFGFKPFSIKEGLKRVLIDSY